jgi:hypothetical protein
VTFDVINAPGGIGDVSITIVDQGGMTLWNDPTANALAWLLGFGGHGRFAIP